MKPILYTLHITSLLFLFTSPTFAQFANVDKSDISTLQPRPVESSPAMTRFVENKGQWADFFDYRLQCWQGNVLFASDRFIYQLYENDYMNATRSHKDAHKAENKSFHAHNYQVTFLNPNPNRNIQKENIYPDYQNYFLGDNPERWKTNIQVASELTYKSLYTGIDMKVYGQSANLKYDFYIKAYTNPAQIQMEYEGIENLRLKNGDLVLQTSAGEVKELAPTAYQIINNRKVAIPCKYVLTGNVLSFDFPSGYDSNSDLIIDPTVVFSTYTGSTQDNWGFTATYDPLGNGYSGGIIFNGNAGQPGYPVMGAYQTVYQGGERDAVITKFNPSGTGLIFSTYLGGSNTDQPHSLVVDGNGNLFVFGRTNSNNFPLYNGYDMSANGSYDIFVTKFSSTGQLLASTLLGGNDADAMNISDDDAVVDGLKYNYGDDARGEIIVDAANNVYIASCTYSTNFPITGGSFRPFHSGLQDGIVAKFNNNLNSLIWSSYIGGNDDDAAYSLELDDQDNIFVTGGTISTNFPTTSNVFQASSGGNIDGFLAKISNNGSSLLKSSYIGTSEDDQSYFVQIDRDNMVYVVGQTFGNFPKSPNTFGTGNGRQFIAKIKNDLSTIDVSMTFGPASSNFPNISPTAFLVDVCKNVYVCGWGYNSAIDNYFPHSSGTSGLPVSSNAYKPTTDGNDFYIIVLENNLQNLLYGTFFGGSGALEHVDGGTSRFDKEGIIYEAVCASCGGSDSNFPHTPGAWSANNNSSNCNLALFKIRLDLAGMNANFQPENSGGGVIQNYEGCAPLTVFFNNLTTGSHPTSTTYFWDFGIGGNTSTLVEPTFTFDVPGTYQIMLVVTDPQACNEKDTSYRSIKVWDAVTVDAGLSQYICGTQTAQLQANVTTGTPNFTYQWAPPTGLSASNIINPTAQPTATTLYTVTATDSKGCNAKDTVRVYTNLLAVVAPADTFFCVGGSVQLQASALNAVSYSWVPTIGLSAANIANPIANPSQTTQYTVFAVNADGCEGKAPVEVNVQPLPVVNLGADQIICSGDTAFLQANAPTATVFLWQPTTGLNDPTIANPYAILTNNQTYNLQVTDAWGCQNNDVINISPQPQIPLFIKPDTIICQGANVQLYALSPNTALSYKWSPSTFLNNPNIPNPFATSPSNILYTLTVTDTTGCERKDSTRITIFETFTIADTMICKGDTLQLTTNGGSTFSWTPASFLSNPNIASPLAFPPNDISYSVTAISDKGCISSKIVAIKVNPLPIAMAGDDKQICQKDTLQLQGSGGITYLWTPNLGLNNNAIENPLANPLTTTTYILTVTDAVGCKNKDSVQITVFPLPVLIAGTPTTICLGDTVPLFVNGAVSYAWTPNAYISDSSAANPYVFPKKSIDYIVTGTDINGCKDTAIVPITLQYNGITQISGLDAACPGIPLTLTASGAQHYVWSTGDTSTSITFIPTNSQWISCIGYNDGCAARPDSIYIILLVLPEAIFTIPDSAFAPVYVSPINQSLYSDTYSWDWGDNKNGDNIPSPTHAYQVYGEYEITLIAYNYRGCSDTTRHKIVVENVTIFVPSAFSPNNDNSNEQFFALHYGIDRLNVQIYSRWGMKIFESNDLNFKWDGSYKGQPVPEGVYVWTIDAVGKNNRPYKLNGTVTLIR